jgi:hypothetical protein
MINLIIVGFTAFVFGLKPYDISKYDLMFYSAIQMTIISAYYHLLLFVGQLDMED